MPRVGLDPDAVVAAAATLADEAGLTALTLSRLAATLGVRTPSLYAHIEGLDDLRERLAERGARDLADAVAGAAAGRAGHDALAALAVAYRRYAAAHPGLYEALQRAPSPGRPRPAAEALTGFVVAVISGYGLRDEDAIHAVRGVRASLHGFVVLERDGGFGLPLSTDESFRRLIEMLDAGLRGRVLASAS